MCVPIKNKSTLPLLIARSTVADYFYKHIYELVIYLVAHPADCVRPIFRPERHPSRLGIGLLIVINTILSLM